MSKLVVADIENASGVEEWNINQTSTTTFAGAVTYDFSSIPSGVKQISISFYDVDHSASDIIVQIGDSGGIETSGYDGCALYHAANTATASNGFELNPYQTDSFTGILHLQLLDSATNHWIAVMSGGGIAGNTQMNMSGTKALSGTLDRVRITTENGSATLDDGLASLQYQF